MRPTRDAFLLSFVFRFNKAPYSAHGGKKCLAHWDTRAEDIVAYGPPQNKHPGTMPRASIWYMQNNTIL